VDTDDDVDDVDLPVENWNDGNYDHPNGFG
jgi:hypothetical protein